MLKLFKEFVLVPIYVMSEVFFFFTSNHVFIWNILSYVLRYGKEKVTKQRQSKRKNSKEKNVSNVDNDSWCYS